MTERTTTGRTTAGHTTAGQAARSTIVVGTDGSDSSRDALLWAADAARRSGAGLRAVYAWDVPAVSGLALGFVPEPDPDVSATAGREVTKQITHALAEAGFSDLPLEVRIRQGHAAQAILDESGDADLIVVGRRGSGGFAAAVMGSVSRYVSAHAARPVVVVPCDSHRAKG
ncbi:universal stress protein [Motilibacter aurantiacus]|uniref:universal stress protein n=1 Tax=Motilibacter aurantiacus TaxID=2714955 RepID=UPI001409BDE0|nr:universal stress protein [Motilibacter aurantiacus]NHC46089.1 universal stress protein [Motilibacter aurantiacus]